MQQPRYAWGQASHTLSSSNKQQQHLRCAHLLLIEAGNRTQPAHRSSCKRHTSITGSAMSLASHFAGTLHLYEAAAEIRQHNSLYGGHSRMGTRPTPAKQKARIRCPHNCALACHSRPWHTTFHSTGWRATCTRTLFACRANLHILAKRSLDQAPHHAN